MRKTLVLILFVVFTINKSYSQTYFDTKNKFGQAKDENGNEMIKPYSVSPVNYSVIDNIFKEFTKDGWLEFNYPQNGCQYRAHYMARKLLERGIKSNKIWSFKPALLNEKSKQELSITDPNFPENKIKWAYHVAPIVNVKMPNGKIDSLVIDPSMFNKPINYKIWLDGLNSKNQYYTFIHGKYIQYQTNSNNILTGVWYTEGYSVDKRWVSTSICKGKIFYTYIQNDILPLVDRIKNLKKTISNTISLKQKEGLSFELRQLKTVYEKRKEIAINSDKFGELPKEYQSMLIECQEYLMDCIYYYWDFIEKNPVMDKCK